MPSSDPLGEVRFGNLEFNIEDGRALEGRHSAILHTEDFAIRSAMTINKLKNLDERCSFGPKWYQINYS
jgi:hypothetical protein